MKNEREENEEESVRKRRRRGREKEEGTGRRGGGGGGGSRDWTNRGANWSMGGSGLMSAMTLDCEREMVYSVDSSVFCFDALGFWQGV